MTSASPVPLYQVGDLASGVRSLIDAARSGTARVEDQDGTILVMLREKDFAALAEIVAGSELHLTIEASLRRPAHDRSAEDFGSAPWLAHLDDEDLQAVADELGAALLAAAASRSADDLRQLVDEWRATAEALADPVRREVLMGPFDPDEYVEVPRPD